jgi:hypothetical protein
MVFNKVALRTGARFRLALAEKCSFQVLSTLSFKKGTFVPASSGRPTEEPSCLRSGYKPPIRGALPYGRASAPKKNSLARSGFPAKKCEDFTCYVTRVSFRCEKYI